MKEYGEVIENVDLKKYNSYGIGGHARYLIKPSSTADLQELRNKSKLAAVDGLKSKDQLVRVGDGYYRAEYILDYLPTLTGSLKFSQQGYSNSCKSLLVEGDNGCVLILPVRPSDKSMPQSVCAY